MGKPDRMPFSSHKRSKEETRPDFFWGLPFTISNLPLSRSWKPPARELIHRRTWHWKGRMLSELLCSACLQPMLPCLSGRHSGCAAQLLGYRRSMHSHSQEVTETAYLLTLALVFQRDTWALLLTTQERKWHKIWDRKEILENEQNSASLSAVSVESENHLSPFQRPFWTWGKKAQWRL